MKNQTVDTALPNLGTFEPNSVEGSEIHIFGPDLFDVFVGSQLDGMLTTKVDR